MVTPEARVKVWQPKGLKGLEVEKLDLSPSELSRRYYHHGYELTVALQGGASIRYAGSRYVFPP